MKKTFEAPPLDALQQRLAQRNAHLADVALKLKNELFGIDAVIDRVIDTIRAWYVMPELIFRPVIVCLWGLTGTGKTQLVRRLVQLLEFQDAVLEVQMDGFSHGSGFRDGGAISSLLAQSGIVQGQPGILLLDEFQRFRTRDKDGDDLKVERYQDVWSLLSDGKLPAPLDMVRDLEMRMARSLYDEEELDDEDRKRKKRKVFQLDAWDASELKELLKLPEAITEIMRWKSAQVRQRLQAFRSATHEEAQWNTDYSRLLIFVAGNLDEMYQHLAERVQDCDTDADVFHTMTGKLGMIDVKKALALRLRPEQIARLGHNHIVYPSLSRAACQQLIAHTCASHLEELRDVSGLRFEMSAALLAALYDNTVFPAQGARPIFSGVHTVLGNALVQVALWALQQPPRAPEEVLKLGIDARRNTLVATYGAAQYRQALQFELQALRQRNNADMRTLLAVHEAGHGIVYGLLLGHAPQEIRINLASFEGGYNRFAVHKAYSRNIWRKLICVGLAGRAAEALVFGPDAVTTGAEQDYRQATEDAVRYVRHFGFDARISRTDVSPSMEDNVNTDVRSTNPAIEALLHAQLQRARRLLQKHRGLLREMVGHLLRKGHISQGDCAALLGLPAPAADQPAPLEPYAAQWQAFERGLCEASPDANEAPAQEERPLGG